MKKVISELSVGQKSNCARENERCHGRRCVSKVSIGESIRLITIRLNTISEGYGMERHRCEIVASNYGQNRILEHEIEF